jgi:hypothetical protein
MAERYAPGHPFPAYAFVPGRLPHPHSHPSGHRFGHDLPEAVVPDPERWADSLHYLLGIDLFNAGYYWEAHECWEALWQACGRRGVLADFFKALIQLAVAGVKVREDKPAGVIAHARRAEELLVEVAAAWPSDSLMGLNLSTLIDYAKEVTLHPPTAQGDAEGQVVFPFALEPITPTRA